MNLELLAQAIRTERELRIKRTSLSGLYLEGGNGKRLAQTLARPLAVTPREFVPSR